jgi:hypothetical protein
MNNLRTLKEKYKLSYRDLEKYTGINFANLHYLVEKKRKFNQIHIASLIAFFDCTADYIIGNSSNGLYVYLKDPVGDVDRILLTEEQFSTLSPFISELIIETSKEPTVIDVFGQQIVLPRYVVYRKFTKPLEELEGIPTETLLHAIVDSISEEKKKKLLTFIEYLM